MGAVLNDLGQQWVAAELAGDTAFLERTLTDDFVGIGPRGFMLNKEQWLARHTTGDIQYHSVTWDEQAVRVYGDAAIVTGRETAHVTYKGQDMPGQFRVTLAFVTRDDGWQMAGLHLSAIDAAP
ncbi:MAG: nuclear transport factor 2 family protein [Dehalococcoidia bacterium]